MKERNSQERCRSSIHPSGMDLQRGQQLHCTVALVVMGPTLDLARAHREHRLPAVEGLDLGLLVHAHDHRILWGSRHSPTTSTTLATKSGSGEWEKVPIRGASACVHGGSCARCLGPRRWPGPSSARSTGLRPVDVRCTRFPPPGGDRPPSTPAAGLGGSDRSARPVSGGRTAPASGRPSTAIGGLPGRSGCSWPLPLPEGSAAPAAPDGRQRFGSWQASRASFAPLGSTRQ
jgi:hypothetical protein